MNPAARGARRNAAAFAIGLGLAVTASPGIALAEDSDSTSSDSRSSRVAAERSGPPATTTQNPERTTQPSRRPRSAAIGNGRETPAERNGPLDITTQTPDRTTQPSRRQRSAAIANGREATAGENPTPLSKDVTPAPAAAVVPAPALPTAAGPVAPAAAAEVSAAVPVVTTSAVSTGPTTSAASNISAALRRVAQVPTPPPAAVMTASPALSASAVVAPTAALSAAATNPLDILAAALSAISREINRLFFNRTPTAKPEQYGLSSSAVATGTIGGWDPDGDPLGYSVTAAPAKGSVVVDTAGTFTYTAGAELASTGGTDTFSVQVRDKGFHLNFWTPTTISVPVTVTIAAPAPTPPDPTPGEPTPPPAVPRALSISDLAVVEGDGGMTHMMFVAGLDGVSTTPVTVLYATANGTATAGLDYTAASGMLTFSPGITEQTIHVTVLGDTTDEQDETLTVTLSNPTGAVLAVATAIGTIVDDDETAVPLTPGLSISDTSATEPTAGVIAPGFLRTSGNQILDSAGNPVQLSGVNWFGMESSTGAPHGLWTRSYQDMIDQMAAAGFNTIRLPYASEALHTTAAPDGIDFWKNPDLQGLNSLQVMDAVIEYAGQQGMRVILDHHRSGFGAGASENGLWFDSRYTEDAWVADWQMLAERYQDNPTVIGMDLHNEPHNGVWGGGGPTDWARAAERAGNAVLAVNPDLLIFVEGVASYQGQSYWWGGNLMGVADRPIVLDVADRVVYSPHDYPNSVYPQPWFQTENFGAALPDKFRQMWGYIYEEGIAPIYIGEFGTRLQDPKDTIWFEAITSYIAGDFDNNGTLDIPAGTEDMSWTFWSWNPNSVDTGGILADDWNTVNQNKMAYLTSIQFDGSGSAVATFTVTLSESSAQPVSVGYLTANGTASAGSDFDAATGILTFAPGETRKTVTVTVRPDSVYEGSENFTVTLSNPIGATLLDAIGIGTITDRGAAAPPTESGGATEPTEPTDPQEPTEPMEPMVPGGTGGDYIDLMTFGMSHGSDHTGMDGLVGGRTPITTEALVAYNDLRRFAGLAPAGLEDVGSWAFANGLTNNTEAWGTDTQGVGLWYAMQGAKVGWIADDKYDPQIIADVERIARLGSAADVMAMVAEYGHDGFADYLIDNGHQAAFLNTLKMEPHYAGWMHDRAHGRLILEGGATAHDVNHLTVLSHDQLQPFMNDTWDWPQWPALDVSDKRVIEYFQSMVALGNPLGDNLTTLDAVTIAV